VTARLGTIVLALLIAGVVAVSPAAAPDRKPPRIVAAALLDADGDSRADRVRITYSERVRHPADRDGRYPFIVSGYRIRTVGKAAGKTLSILLVEQAQPDPTAVPTIRYRRVRQQPVNDRAGNQALAQLFTRTTAHGSAPADPPAPPPAAADADKDGTIDADDCGPRDAAIHPGAADVPDLQFVDSNCDGIDGTEKDAVFASPAGNDQDPGTKERPKREIQAALQAATAGKKRYVLVAFGSYDRVALVSGKSIFGGYDPASWQRRNRFPDGLPIIEGSPEAVLASEVKDVVIQHVSVRGVASSVERSAYGIRAINGSSLTLQRVVVSPGNGTAGLRGTNGQAGARAGDGAPGGSGSCDGPRGAGGAGGASVVDRRGGRGGDGGWETERFGGIAEHGDPGGKGNVGTAGGAGGEKGNPGHPGLPGDTGALGVFGSGGAGGTSSASSAGQVWIGQKGGAGTAGKPGNGGGGGGGGGSQQGLFVDNGGGNAGGGGGGGGGGGTGGTGGGPGGGSFGIYLEDSRIVVESSSIAAGVGGAGGRGGDGGIPGAGGKGGRGARVCTSEVGAGGNGGAGGAGGRGGGGGGGAGGPSVGIFKLGTSTASVRDDSKVTAGTAGAGGAGGGNAPGGAGAPGRAGIAMPVFP
jgi:hypothetical protein